MEDALVCCTSFPNVKYFLVTNAIYLGLVLVNAKIAVPNVDSAHPTAKDQPLTIAHIKGREADMRVMSELNLVLDKKAMSSTKDDKDSFMRAVEALNSIDKLQFTPDIRMPLIKSTEPENGSISYQKHLVPNYLETAYNIMHCYFDHDTGLARGEGVNPRHLE
ncbi:hypothetical protein V6N13_080035 [Hibiscus sabdariffa]|uniref:Uncharacterized protein n=1 Tax=Hibiscus sabdariffa TaxID=183260 RepID=A0ABR2RTT8_9ROSI